MVAQATYAPILMVSAIASGQGKTTVTAALARHFVQAGKRVRVFKTGADFIDPMMLERACGSPVLSLDLWLLGLPACRALLNEAARNADLVLIEGVMGLYDGDPSSADLANAFGVPVLAVVDASAMAQTVGAVVLGLRDFGPVKLAGVIANCVASDGHREMIRQALRDIPLLASLSRQEHCLPERHLGLVLPNELANLDALLDQLGQGVRLDESAWQTLQIDSSSVADQSIVDQSIASQDSTPRLLNGLHIAIAKDAAFAFLYPANISCLEEMGARLSYFSPLADHEIPQDADAVYLPGGYPELHGKSLSLAMHWQASIRAFHESGKPICAECGGMMCLVDSLIDADGSSWPMVGILAGTMRMQKRLSALGMQSLRTADGELRGHTFHFSRFETNLTPADFAIRQRTGDAGEAVYRVNGLHASYFHAYFPSNPNIAAQFFLPRVFMPNATNPEEK